MPDLRSTVYGMPVYSSDKRSYTSFIVSLICHFSILAGIPLLVHFMYHADTFKRPNTFSLVSMPAHLSMPQPKAPVVKTPGNEPVHKSKSTTQVPKKQNSKQVAKAPDKPVENTDDLNELLSAIPSQKVSDIATESTFRYPWYLQNICSRVEEKWTPPNGLTEKTDAAVLVSFSVMADGSVSGITVSKSSGTPTLDNLAVRAIKLAAPFGKLPVGFTENRLDISYTLYYVKK